MNDSHSGEGGAANTPPFPRRPSDGPSEPIGDASRTDRDEPLGAVGDPSSMDAGAEARPERPAVAGEESDHMEDRPELSAASREDSDYDEDRPEPAPFRDDPRYEEGPPLRPPPEPIGRRAAREFRSQADRTLQRGFSRLADQLDEVADRVNRVSSNRFAGAPGAGAADSTATWMEETANYLRSSDLAAVQTDIEERVRERPLQSLLLALGAGWLLGRIMR